MLIRHPISHLSHSLVTPLSSGRHTQIGSAAHTRGLLPPVQAEGQSEIVAQVQQHFELVLCEKRRKRSVKVEESGEWEEGGKVLEG